MNIKGTLQQLYEWSIDDEHQWRSWLGHFLLVFCLAKVFGIGVGLGIYFFREGEQALMKTFKGEPIDARDSLLDVVIPMVALAPVAWLLGWAG